MGAADSDKVHSSSSVPWVTNLQNCPHRTRYAFPGFFQQLSRLANHRSSGLDSPRTSTHCRGSVARSIGAFDPDILRGWFRACSEEPRQSPRASACGAARRLSRSSRRFGRPRAARGRSPPSAPRRAWRGCRRCARTPRPTPSKPARTRPRRAATSCESSTTRGASARSRSWGWTRRDRARSSRRWRRRGGGAASTRAWVARACP